MSNVSTVSTVLIRAATLDDVPTLFALIKSLADYEKLSDSVVGSAEALKDHLFGDRPCIQAVLAEAVLAKADSAEADLGGNRKPAGFALFFYSYSTFLAKPGIYLEDLFVSPDCRGQGIGKALLSHLAQRVLEQSGGRLEWSVLDWNESAIAFYQKIGAVISEDTRICRVTREHLPKTAAALDASAAKIRPVTPNDLPALCRLLQAKAEFDRQLHSFSSDSEAIGQHLFGARPYLEGLVAVQAEQIVGFATFSPNYSTFLTQPGIYLEDLFVLPHHRAQGIGKALLANLAQIAIDRRCGRLEWLVATWNDRAIAFYQRMGATVLPDWRICRMTGGAIANLAKPA